jgi:hypothetical protein
MKIVDNGEKTTSFESLPLGSVFEFVSNHLRGQVYMKVTEGYVNLSDGVESKVVVGLVTPVRVLDATLTITRGNK